MSHRTREHALYAYPAGQGRLVYPDWQLAGAATIPRLPQVVGALLPGEHPVAVRRFMTTPDDELAVDGHATSPRDWLIAGDDPFPVIELAATMGATA